MSEFIKKEQKCPNCEDEGYTIEPVCCGRYRIDSNGCPSGCCGSPVPEQVQCNCNEFIKKDTIYPRQIMGKPTAYLIKDAEGNARFLEICGAVIDLSKIQLVGESEGNPDYLRYFVYFVGGSKMEIFERRRYIGNSKVIQFPRQDLIQSWRLCIDSASVPTCTANERLFLDEIREKGYWANNNYLHIETDTELSIFKQSMFQANLKELVNELD